MSLIQNIKNEQLQARKNRDSVKALALTTLIGEAEIIGKNNGNREVNDQEVISLLKKFIKGAKEVASTASDYNDRHRTDIALEEVEIYQSYLPKQLSKEELQLIINDIIADRALGVPEAKPKLSTVIQDLKNRYDGRYDGATAARLIKAVLTK